MKHDLRSPQHSSIAQLLEDEFKASSLKGLTSAPSFLQRKIQNIQNDLERTKQWNHMQELLDRGDSLDEFYELRVGDHKIKFEGDLNPYERRNLLFKKIKKLKKGEGILNKRLEEARELLEGKKSTPTKTSTLAMVKPVWGKEEKVLQEIKSPSSQSEDFKVFKFENFSIGVGLSATGNDQLRNKWSHKEDWWLHLDGMKSSHAIVKLKNAGPIESEILHLAASILAQFSHFQDQWIPIIFTQVKNLKGVSGAPGMVIYKKEKHLRCPQVHSEEWLKD
jgi:predicted ribosome quality control (RQC) complex YloA/Tae2 family protein